MDGLDVVRGLRGLDVGADRRAVRARHRGRQGRGARPRRRRLPHQAVRHGRAVRARCGPRCAEPCSPRARRSSTTPDFTIDFTAKQVRRGDELVRLTPTQWHIVEVLVRNAGRLVTYEQLLQEVWGPTYGKETNYLRVFMTQIRHKLEPEPSHARGTSSPNPGIGFRFEAPDDAGVKATSMAEVVLVRWPEEREEARSPVGRRRGALPRGCATTIRRSPTTCLEDWVRIAGRRPRPDAPGSPRSSSEPRPIRPRHTSTTGPAPLPGQARTPFAGRSPSGGHAHRRALRRHRLRR